LTKPKLKAGINETANTIFNDINAYSLEKPIRFSLKFCDTKKYCIRKLEDTEINKFYETLGKFEAQTWKEVRSLQRENGFSVEKKDSDNFKYLKGNFNSFNNFFHFRGAGTNNLLRVYATQVGDLCYLLLIDRNGKINH